MDNFYEFWQRIDQQNLLSEADQLISKIELILETPESSTDPNFALSGTGKGRSKDGPISKRIRDFGAMGGERGVGSHNIEVLAKEHPDLKGEFQMIGSLLRGLLGRAVKYDVSDKYGPQTKMGQGWLTIKGNEMFDQDGKSYGNLTNKLSKALMLARGYVDEDGKPSPFIDFVDSNTEKSLAPNEIPGSGTSIVAADTAYEGNYGQGGALGGRGRRSSKAPHNMTPQQIAQQERKNRPPRIGGQSVGDSMKAGKELRAAIDQYKMVKSQGNNASPNDLQKYAQEVLRIANDVRRQSGRIDTAAFKKLAGFEFDQIPLILQKIQGS